MSSMFCLIYYSLKSWRYVEISIIAVRATEVKGRTINVVVHYIRCLQGPTLMKANQVLPEIL